MSVLESVLADRLGASRPDLREIRKKTAPPTMWNATGKGIVWTDEGAGWLENLLSDQSLNGPDEGVESSEGVKGPSAADKQSIGGTELRKPPPPVRLPPVVHKELVVAVVYKKNRKLLLAKDEEGSEHRVRVRNNEFFVPGQVIPCIHQNSNLWTLNGRCPKARGKLYKKVGR